MACSTAQLESNRKNALRSTGPRTPEGKERSRRNGLKHGLTGSGAVLSAEDAAEIQRRVEALEAEMAPRSELAERLVGRIALLTVKLDRCSEQEAKAISYRMRRAAADFDDARLAEIEKAFSWIAHEPATHVRRIKMHPEGIDMLIHSLESLRSDVDRADGVRWSWAHCEQWHHVMGRRSMEVPVTRARALSEAVMGEMSFLEAGDRPELSKLDRQCWAAAQILVLIDEQVAELKRVREGLDLTRLELDRLEAPARAMFDGSKEAVLARKYEAANERSMYRAMREFREVQAEVVADEEVAGDPADELGSDFLGPFEDDDEIAGVDTTTTAEDVRDLISGLEGRSGRANRPDLARIRRQRRR